MEFATEMITEVFRHLTFKEVTVPLNKAYNERTEMLPGWVDGAGWGKGPTAVHGITHLIIRFSP